MDKHADRPPLTREAVLDAAIAIADAEGLPKVTMRRIGERLGVEAMSLYNHVKNKQDILDGMASHLIAGMNSELPSGEDSWQDVLRAVSRAYRALVATHPAVFTNQGGRPLVAGDDKTAFDAIIGRLLDAGFELEVALDLFQIGSSYVRGFALSDIAYAGTTRTVPDAWDSDRAFERGLDVIINGFAGYLRN